MQGNINFERNTRKERLSKPPRDAEVNAKREQAKRGKSWVRENNKREQWDNFQ